MDQRKLGLALMVLGVIVLIAAAVLSSGSDSTEAAAAEASTTTAAAAEPTTVATEAPTTTAAATTTTTTAESSTTTAAPDTTATTAATTTTTLAATDRIAAFIQAFGEALAAGDVDTVFASLHPDIVSGFGEDACRTWVENEIMGLGNYVQNGDPVGPAPGSLATTNGTVSLENVYAVPIAFDFSGSSFELSADFVVEDDAVYFTGSCA